jgi:hypothetical protein
MIDLDKAYETQDGREVVLLGIIEERYGYPVLGLYLDDGDWEHTSWTMEGLVNKNDPFNDLNLVEVGDSVPALPTGIRVPKFGPETGAELATASEASLQAWGRFLVPSAASG